ncbi:MAG: OmpA family protein [Treponema sp.]|nr:OmpA family protein [Treponema sp.]
MEIKVSIKKYNFALLLFSLLTAVLSAQTGSSSSNLSYWSLNAGVTNSFIDVNGSSFGLIAEPRFDLPYNLMIGSKNGINFSTDKIITLETQIYLRWNFLRVPSGSASPRRSLDFFIQGGAGFIGALNGPDYIPNHNNIIHSRSSLLGDFSLGLTIPLPSMWQIEPSFRGGYPFIWGFALTAGYKFPLGREITRETVREVETIREVERAQEVIVRTEYIEVINRLMITQIEYILFAGDISAYNVNLDSDARSLNDLVINEVVKMLLDNPDLRANIEGHANPVTGDPDEVQILFALSSNRAHEVARLLRERGVSEEQMVVVAFGAGKVLTTDRLHWNMNRRVEIILYQTERNQ